MDVLATVITDYTFNGGNFIIELMYSDWTKYSHYNKKRRFCPGLLEIKKIQKKNVLYYSDLGRAVTLNI